MGNTCQPDLHKQPELFNPSQLDFKRTHPIALSSHYIQLLDRLKNICEFPDARENPGLKWFHSAFFDLYMYGDLLERKPNGNCLFFLKNLSPGDELPVIIATSINEENTYHKQTLLIYPDKSYYLGQIINSSMQPPKAEGKGLLVSRQFIYEGDFENGLPHGFGTFRSKASQLVGEFREGEPYGRCVERSKSGLFLGELVSRYRKNGRLITPQNQVELVNEEYRQPMDKEHTMVEL